MGKTEKGALFLDPEVISPYDFFQYWRNVPDEDVEKFLLLYTFLPVAQIKELGELKDRDINRAKEVLAYELTTLIHGRDEADRAREAARAAFDTIGAAAGSGDTSGIPSTEVVLSQLSNGLNAADLFSLTGLCASKSDARRLISQGGATVNGRKVGTVDEIVDESWLEGDELLLRAGKKRYYRVVVRR